MKVLFAPISKQNPYQHILKSNLEELKLSVSFISDNRLCTFFRFSLSKKCFHVLHLHWTHSYILSDYLFLSFIKSFVFLISLIILKLKNYRIVWTLHNLREHELRHVKLENFVHKILFKLCDNIIVHSVFCKNEAMRFWQDSPAKKFHVIPHGNYIGSYLNEVTKEQARVFLNIPKGKSVFLFFGSLRGYKGLDAVLKSFESNDLLNSVLLIVGHPLTRDIEAKIRAQCHEHSNVYLYLDHVPADNVQFFMNASDAVVFSFSDIFTSGSIVLAMSFRKAVIAPNLPALQHLIDYGGVITYEADNPDNLKNIILASTRLNLNDFGDLNYQLALSFNWPKIARDTLDVYELSLG